MDDNVNAYGLNPQQAQAAYTPPPMPTVQAPQAAYNLPPQGQATSQPGMFDSVPFHDWLAKNAQEKYGVAPHELSNDQIKKGVDDYIDGPITNIIAHNHVNAKGAGSDLALKDKIKYDTEYYRMLAKNEIESNLDAVKGHLQSLKPATAAAQPTTTLAKPDATPDYGYKGLLDSSAYKGPLQNPIVGGLIDNPLTRGLGQGANTAATGLSEVARRIVDPQTAKNIQQNIENPLIQRGGVLSTPENANVLESGVQTAGNIAGTLAPAAVTGGAGGIPGALAAGATIGIPAAGNEAIQKEQETGAPVSGGRLAAMAATDSLVNALPLGKQGQSLMRAFVTGNIGGAAGNVIMSAISGEPVNAEDVAKAGLTTGFLNSLLHLPPNVIAKLRDAVTARTAVGKENIRASDVAKAVPASDLTQPRGFVDANATSGEAADAANLAAKATGAGNQGVPLSEEHQATLDASAPLIAEAETQEQAQALHDQLAAKVPPEQRAAFTTAYNAELENAHGDNAPKIIPTTPEPVPSAPAQGENASTTTPEGAATAPEAGTPVAGAVGLESLPGMQNATREKVNGLAKPVEVTFDNPVDKAAYLLSRKDTPTGVKQGIRDALHAQGMGQEEITSHSKKVAGAVKKNADEIGHKFSLESQLVPKPVEAPKDTLKAKKAPKPPKA